MEFVTECAQFTLHNGRVSMLAEVLMNEQENDCTSHMTNQLEFLSNTHKSEVYISSAKKGQGMSGSYDDIYGTVSFILYF